MMGFLAACTPQVWHADVAQKVRSDYNGRCPADQVLVRSEHVRGGQTVYVVDACGVLLELERGLVMPLKRRDLAEILPEETRDTPRYARPVPPAVLESVRMAAQGWCKVVPAEDRSEDDVAFYVDSAEEQRACRERVAASIAPRGTFYDSRTKKPTYAFWMGTYAFDVTETLHTPACENLMLKGTPEACRCSGRPETECAALRVDHPGRDEMTASAAPRGDSRKKASRFYGRITLGPSYLGHDTAFGDYEGGAVGTGVSLAARVTPELALGLTVGGARAWEAKSVSYERASADGLWLEHVETTLQPYVAETWATAAFFPQGPRGFFVEAEAGGVAVERGRYMPMVVSPAFGGALGYDDPSNLTLIIRGFHAPGGDATTAASLQLGWVGDL